MTQAGVCCGTKKCAGRLCGGEEASGAAELAGICAPQTVSQTEIPAPPDTGLGEAVKGAETWD